MNILKEDFLETVEQLRKAADHGYWYVAFPLNPEFRKAEDFKLFERVNQAHKYARNHTDYKGAYAQRRLKPFVEELEKIALSKDLPNVLDLNGRLSPVEQPEEHFPPLTRMENQPAKDQPVISETINQVTITNHIIMNLNNLENLKDEVKTLGFKEKTISEMEKNMEKGVPEFTLNEKIAASRGQVDLTLHFKQSGQSEHYFFNKFEVAHHAGKALEDGQKYTVIMPNEAGRNMTKSFENVGEAITFFKEQKGNSELAIVKGEGKDRDMEHRTKLATMENGKVNYVAKEFQRTFRAPAVTQTFWVERGKGFTAEQAANLIQGRSVYRDDLLNLGGQPYKAWIKLDMDTPKDRHQNFLTNQYHDPSYGFNLEKVLDKFQIKELNDPAKKEALENTLKNGNRPLITTVKEGQEVKMFIEAVPRYGQVNLYREDGKPEKREQFLKQPLQEQMLQIGKAKGHEKEQEQGMRI